MRLANSQKGVGLSGIRARSDIPECWGMHRIHQSGYYEQAAETLVSWTASGRGVPSNERALRLQQSVSSTPIFEGGGVEIIRPLLKFGKQDLVSTCVAHGVTWTEDETNKDVWRTPRNATRSLLGKCRLPKALSRDPLIRLSRRMVAKHVVHKLSATRSFMRCEILLFDLRSGSIVVRLPEIDDIGVNFTAVSMAHLASKPLVASLLLQRLTSQITPHEGVPLHSLQVAVDAMFPELRYQEKNDLGKKKSPSRFTAAGVQFDRLPSPLVDVASDARSIQLAGTPQPLSHGPDRQNSWSLTRQPFMNKRASSKSQSSENTLPTILISTSPIVSESNSFPWSSWSLWDGRYWIRVKNSTVQTLQVRPFREVDLKAIRKSLPKSRLKPLEEVLASAAPNKVRFTLPVISEASKDIDKPGKVLALPTLGLVGQLKVESGQGVRNLEWEIRYKEVDLGCNEEGDRRENKNIITSWRDS